MYLVLVVRICVLKLSLNYGINLKIQINNPDRNIVKNAVISSLLDLYKIDWIQDINRESAMSGLGHNKLRTYRLFKTESYLYYPVTRAHRRSCARFHCGVAPLRLEIGRYKGLAESERVCFNCEDTIENKEHVLLVCPLYDDLRQTLLQTMCGTSMGYSDLCIAYRNYRYYTI